ncbi:TRAP transporter permease [Limnochorda pilosa]|uniref:Permease n=1 Tax=Limnochorda pilosa TaxID=1555112 RepID=A0A0K2SGB9_LIMPI|nr:TRAP transporter permease [Limnochorda pilosa]BAS25889.1 permease [Limnochorda pilosa]
MSADRRSMNEQEHQAVDAWVLRKWGAGPVAQAVRRAYLAVAVALGVYAVLSVSALSLDSYLQRVWYLLFILVLVFLVEPARAGGAGRRPAALALDMLLLAASVTVSLYIVVDYDGIIWRMGLPSSMDVVMGTVALLVLLEATRRAVGWSMAVIVLLFLAYAYLGGYVPGFFGHMGYSHARIINQLYLFQEGIYGVPLGVASTYVFLFVLFGGFLEKTGAGAFFIDLAYSLTGRARGGPAKAAVVSSALMGSISGSAIANVVTTGAFTIPMMKRVGYEPHEAAGVEAAASTGGQVLPPVMGAGAFLMAEFTGIPYLEIVKVSIIPALMYFAVVFLFVDIVARRKGIRGLAAEEIPRLRATLAEGFHYLIPMVALVYMLFRMYTALQAGTYALALLVVVAMLRAASRLSLRDVLDAFRSAAKSALMVSVATAAAGIIVGVVGLTGLGLKFSGLMLSFSGNNLLLALILIALASLVLGMGLPVTASYVVLIVLAGPALQEMGLGPLTAHMIVFWLSQDSNVTPPVALAAFAAAGIAGASPMRTGMAGWKYAKGLYLIPLLMAYTPLLLNGPPLAVVQAVVSGLLGLVAFAVFLEGYLVRPVTLFERGLLAVATVGLLTPQRWLDFVGMAVIAGFLVSQLWFRRPPGIEQASSAAGD